MRGEGALRLAGDCLLAIRHGKETMSALNAWMWATPLSSLIGYGFAVGCIVGLALVLLDRVISLGMGGKV